MGHTAPNILVFMTDDHGQWAARCYGNRELVTPSMDYLAQTGSRMNRAFTPSPVCSPARASFLTGRLPSQHGIHDWIKERGEGMDHPGLQGQTNVGQLLQSAGYQTGLIGKWHCGRSWVPHPGFDRWFSYQNDQLPHVGVQGFSDQGTHVVRRGHQANLITDQVINFLRDRTSDDPFFLLVGYVNTHPPHEDQPERLARRYRKGRFDDIPHEQFPPCHGRTRFRIRDFEDPEYLESLAQYYAAVTVIDEQVGRVLDELDGSGQLDSTLVVYTSDHGLMKGHHGTQMKGNSTVPQNFFEESILVPCLLSWPEGAASGAEPDALVDHCDLFMTLLDVAGVRLDSRTAAEIRSPGRSYLPVLEGDVREPWGEQVFGEYGNARMVRTRDRKLIRRYPGPTGRFPDELYDLSSDPRETDNVFENSQYTSACEELSSRLESHFSRYEFPDRSGLRLDEQPRHNECEPWRVSRC